MPPGVLPNAPIRLPPLQDHPLCPTRTRRESGRLPNVQAAAHHPQGRTSSGTPCLCVLTAPSAGTQYASEVQYHLPTLRTEALDEAEAGENKDPLLLEVPREHAETPQGRGRQSTAGRAY